MFQVTCGYDATDKQPEIKHAARSAQLLHDKAVAHLHQPLDVLAKICVLMLRHVAAKVCQYQSQRIGQVKKLPGRKLSVRISVVQCHMFCGNGRPNARQHWNQFVPKSVASAAVDQRKPPHTPALADHKRKVRCRHAHAQAKPPIVIK